MEVKFRKLEANEIDCRVSTVSEKGCSVLLYKDARCDMNILDECVGAMNWTRSHSRDNANCTVSIWDSEKNVWVSKEDTGTESNTEKEKGLASDSFKRACFNWGIGRELYTAPFIWVTNSSCKIEKNPKTGKATCYDKFSVREIGYDEKGCICALDIWNNTQKKPAFRFGMTGGEPFKNKPVFISVPMQKALCAELDRVGKTYEGMLEWLKIQSLEEITVEQFDKLMDSLTKHPDKVRIPPEMEEEMPFN